MSIPARRPRVWRAVPWPSRWPAVWAVFQKLGATVTIAISRRHAVYGALAGGALFLTWMYLLAMFILLGRAGAGRVGARGRAAPPRRRNRLVGRDQLAARYSYDVEAARRSSCHHRRGRVRRVCTRPRCSLPPDARVTVVDRRNFHLFQPLLYQVATGGLSPGDIASPIRSVLKRGRRARVIQDEAVDVLRRMSAHRFARRRCARLRRARVATGSQTSYFGHDDWAQRAPGLKTVEDALEMRSRVLGAFERAEVETDRARRAALLTFVVIGGGPTGVELAGAVAELARVHTRARLPHFRPARPRASSCWKVASASCPAFPSDLAAKAVRSLERLGVEVSRRAPW